MQRIEGLNVKWINGKAYFGTTPPYTEITPEFLNAIQEELMNVVEQAGFPVLGVSNDTRDQLWNAIKGLAGEPVGSIIAWLPGYFTDGINGGYIAVTTITLTANWRLCDGSEINDPSSPIFNGAGRFIANLTDDRFLMGDISASAGGIGGVNSQTHSVPAHYHGMGLGATLGADLGGSHNHNLPSQNEHYDTAGSVSLFVTSDADEGTLNTNSGGSHTHTISGLVGLVTGGVDGNAAMTSGSSENRPVYLSCQYIMRVK